MTAQSPSDNDPGGEPTLFSAIITPHRSLTSTGFVLVMALVGGFSFIGGLVFFAIGAWPVVGFLGLDVLLVYWAFRINYRAATAFEEVTVTPSELRVLFLVTRGKKLPVAGFLSPAERESFATALSVALGEAKRGPTRAVI